MKRHFLAAALAGALLLSGCAGLPSGGSGQAQPVQEQTVSSLSQEQFPLFGGCRALTALGRQTAAAVLDCSLGDARAFVRFAGSSGQAWDSLGEGELEVALAYAPTEKQQSALTDSGAQVQKAATDALVFLVSEGSDVRGLTQKQIARAYGAKNVSVEGLVAYSAAQGSSSQAAFAQFFDGTGKTIQMVGGDGENRAVTQSTMGKGDVLCYALAQTIATDGVPEGMRVIAVDDVKPGAKTIADGSYPLCVNIYAGLSPKAVQNPGAQALYQWLCSEEGMAFLQSEPKTKED